MRFGFGWLGLGLSLLVLAPIGHATGRAALGSMAEKVEGTIWQGTDGERELTLRFIKGGILSYTTPTGTFRNATWLQEGNKVYYQTNLGYAIYEGVLDGTEIKGNAKNVNQLTWTWSVKKSGVLEDVGPIPNLSNTLWEGTDSDGDAFAFRFKLEPADDGVRRVVELIRPNSAAKVGTWNQEDEEIYVEINNQFSEYKGTIKGLVMEGSASNKNNLKWTWKLTQKPDAFQFKTTPADKPKTSDGPKTPITQPSRTIHLAGTTWSGSDSDGEEFSFRFGDDGKVDALRPNKETKTGTFTIKGDTVTVEIGNRFSTYVGKISGEQMEGSASNVRGLKWTWKLRKTAGPSIFKEESVPAPSLAGSTWKGEDSDGDEFSFQFFADGSLEVTRYDAKQDREVRNKNATWKLTGSDIYIEINNQFSEYRGTITADTMEGSATNRNNKSWTWKLKRVDAKAASLAGTKWKSRDSDGDEYTFHFRPDGTLEFTSITTGKTSTTATWKQTGNQIYMEMNNRFSEYRGTLMGNTIEGTASNIKNHKWTWKATKE